MKSWPGLSVQQLEEGCVCESQIICLPVNGQVYWECNGELPEIIIMHRDGVSEGQFIKMLDIEVDAIRQVCLCGQLLCHRLW